MAQSVIIAAGNATGLGMREGRGCRLFRRMANGSRETITPRLQARGRLVVHGLDGGFLPGDVCLGQVAVGMPVTRHKPRQNFRDVYG